MEPKISLPALQEPANLEALCNISLQIGSLGRGVVSPLPNP